MGFWKRAVSRLNPIAPFSAAKDSLGEGGRLNRLVGNLSGQTGRRQQRNDVSAAADQATGYTTSGYGSARTALGEGRTASSNTLRGGFQRAHGYYDTPDMTSAREVMAKRARGEGGYGADTVATMKASVGDEYGLALRDTQNALRSYYGDSAAPGMAGENLVMGANLAGQNRAKGTRDIDVGNALLALDQQTGGVNYLAQEAGQRAGLSTQEANALAALESQYGINVANLSTEEAQMLAQIAIGKGINFAQTRSTMNYWPDIIKAGAQAGAAAMSGGASIPVGGAADAAGSVNLPRPR